MASQTTNLHLTLPVGTENVSRQVINTNMSTIDSAVGAVPNGQNLQSQVTNLANESSSLKSALKSRFNGKKLSIIGDSIDTFNKAGYKIDGYNMYYPALGVTDVNQTWWKRVMDNSGMVMEVNASWSGSRVTNTHSDPTYPDFYDRVSVIGSPDVIFVTLGTNDSANDVALGDYDFTTIFTSLSESTFRTAYIKGVKALKALYPSAEIVCISENMKDVYKASIEYIAKQMSVTFIDASDYICESGVHPGILGMKQIAARVLYPTDSRLWQKHFPADAASVGVFNTSDNIIGKHVFNTGDIDIVFPFDANILSLTINYSHNAGNFGGGSTVFALQYKTSDSANWIDIIRDMSADNGSFSAQAKGITVPKEATSMRLFSKNNLPNEVVIEFYERSYELDQEYEIISDEEYTFTSPYDNPETKYIPLFIPANEQKKIAIRVTRNYYDFASGTGVGTFDALAANLSNLDNNTTNVFAANRRTGNSYEIAEGKWNYYTIQQSFITNFIRYYYSGDVNNDKVRVQVAVYKEKKEEAIKTDIQDLKEKVSGSDYVDITFDGKTNIDEIIDFDESIYTCIIKVIHQAGSFGTQGGITYFAIQKANVDPMTDIARYYTSTGGNYPARNEFVCVPAGTTKIRVAYRNGATGLTLRLWKKNMCLEPGYNVLKTVDFTRESTNTEEKTNSFFRCNFDAGKTYHIAVFIERDGLSKKVITSDGIKLYKSNMTDSDAMMVARNRISDNEFDCIYNKWNYYTVTPAADMAFVQIYISAVTTTARVTVACKEISDRKTIGLNGSIARIGNRYLKESMEPLYPTTINHDYGHDMQCLTKLPNNKFALLRSEMTDQSLAQKGTIHIVDNVGGIENRTGYSMDTYYVREEFYHPISSILLDNGNLLVCSKTYDEERYTYEYNYQTNTIVNTYYTPKAEPDNEDSLALFAIPANDDIGGLFVGYHENYGNIHVYRFLNNELDYITEIESTEKYGQDVSIFDNKLFMLMNEGATGNPEINEIIILDLNTWTVSDRVHISAPSHEGDGIDVGYENGDIVIHFAGNLGYPIIRNFYLS